MSDTVKKFLDRYEPTRAKFFGKPVADLDKEQLLRFISWWEEDQNQEKKRQDQQK